MKVCENEMREIPRRIEPQLMSNFYLRGNYTEINFDILTQILFARIYDGYYLLYTSYRQYLFKMKYCF